MAQRWYGSGAEAACAHLRTVKKWKLFHWSRVALSVQFLALICTLGEYFRLKLSAGNAFTMDDADPLVLGALIAAILTAIATWCHIVGRHGWTLMLSALTVLALLMVKYALVG
jgi:hypothetical protein